MAVTYGFYNALNHDRVYDAIQMSSIFDGIIRDGVFSTIGEALTCRASGSGLVVNVSSGRAWFNHTWTLNDTDYPVEAEEAEVVLDRIDAIVLEVNSAVEVRANTIKFIKGTPSQNPVRPTLIHNSEVNQYALAYVNIRAGQTTIFDSDITNVVGTDETPFITGLMQQVSIEELIRQWEDDFNRHFATWVAVNEAQYDLWTADMQAQYNAWMAGKVNEYQAWYASMQAEGDADLAEFDAWFQHMKDQLDTDAAGHLQAEIDALALDAEKGSVVTVTTINTELYGRTVTISQNGQSRTAIFDNNGVAVFSSIPYVGVVEISSTDGSQTAVAELTIPYFGRYEQAIAFWAATVNITTTSPEFYSKQITVSRDNVVIGTTAFSALGRVAYTATSPGLYKFTVRYDGMDFDVSTNVTEETTYNLILNAWTATLNIISSLTTLYGRPISISKGGIVVGTTSFDATGHATYKVHETGTYLVSSSDAGGNTYEDTVVVTEETAYSVSLGSPQGSTVLPTDSIPTWLACAGLTVGYTTLAEVLADETTLDILLRDSNACDYMARSTTWAKQEGQVPTMTDNTHPSGEAFASSYYTDQEPYKAFDNNSSTYWSSAGSSVPESVGYHFTSPKIIKCIGLCNRTSSSQYTHHQYAETCKVQGSNDGTTWVDIGESFTYYPFTLSATPYWTKYPLSNNTEYSYYRFVVESIETGAVYNPCCGSGIQFFEDTDITTDRDAMTRIGLYDYCSEKLLSNATWAEAIAESEYFESVLNGKVPIMTGYTTPEGECFGAAGGGGTTVVNCFDGNDSTGLYFTQNVDTVVAGYKFTSPIKILAIDILQNQGAINYKLEGSNDGSNYTTIESSITGTVGNNHNKILVNNDTEYLYYRIRSNVSPSGGNGYLYALQFYGRRSSVQYQPLVPAMTSATTPSGEVTTSQEYNAGYAWNAFDNNWTKNNIGGVGTAGVWSAYDANNHWICYDFGAATTVVKFAYRQMHYIYGSTNYYGAASYKIQGSDDGSNWIDITSNLTGASDDNKHDVLFDSPATYRYFRMYVNSSSSPNMCIGLANLQFYGIAPVTDRIHSCPNDTIYMMEDGSPVTLCTTDLNGVGSVDWSQFEPGTYTFYSSVAKDPSNLSNDYSKTVRITKGAFGHTTDLYLMPDPVKMTYWYGYNKNCELISNDNGWTNGYTLRTSGVAFNTNDVDITEDGYHCWGGIGSKKASLGRYVKAIMKTTTTGKTYTPLQNGSTTKTSFTNPGYTGVDYPNATLITQDMTNEDLYYALIADTQNYEKLKVYALWIE